MWDRFQVSDLLVVKAKRSHLNCCLPLSYYGIILEQPGVLIVVEMRKRMNLDKKFCILIQN